jgi:hypothetical protein
MAAEEKGHVHVVTANEEDAKKADERLRESKEAEKNDAYWLPQSQVAQTKNDDIPRPTEHKTTVGTHLLHNGKHMELWGFTCTCGAGRGTFANSRDAARMAKAHELGIENIFVDPRKTVSPDTQTEREKILDEVRAVICKDRDVQYGEPEDNFAVIAQFWNIYLNVRRRKQPDFLINAFDVGVMQSLMKMARLSADPTKRDSLVDSIGYLACVAGVQSKETGGA